MIKDKNMKGMHPLAGIYAAAATPLDENGSLDLGSVVKLLEFLAERGCHGVLLLGTTGEGPSFNFEERLEIWKVAVEMQKSKPGFRLLAASGTPSLSETIKLNRMAFEIQMDAVVVLPPFYFRNASDEGLFDWFAQVIENSVPKGKYLLGYHIPQVSGVGLSFELLERLHKSFPNRFGGLKDSSGDLAHAKALVELLPGKAVLVGNDRVLGGALMAGGSGGITALANLRSPLLRVIWDSYLNGEDISKLQDELSKSRAIMDNHPSTIAFVKAMLHELHGFPDWALRPPLTAFDERKAKRIAALFSADMQ